MGQDSSDGSMENFLIEIFNALMCRQPNRKERAEILSHIDKGEDLTDLINQFLQSPERQAIAKNVGYPPGHFYSALVDVNEAKGHMGNLNYSEGEVFNAINIDVEEMDDLWSELSGYFEQAPWGEEPSENLRYHYQNKSYPYTDALVFSALLQYKTPKKIIEVGSGFTSAVLLDTLEHKLSVSIDITFIQPYPHTIERILRKEDRDLYTLIQEPVQNVDLSLYNELEAGDIFFIDSTHVVKTGSDVVHEILEILPRLKPGVLVHFHDIFYPFEYPDNWVRKFSRSWNEIYMLRAYLQDNPNYRVLMFNNYYVRNRLPESAYKRDRFLRSPGGGMWLERI